MFTSQKERSGRWSGTRWEVLPRGWAWCVLCICATAYSLEAGEVSTPAGLGEPDEPREQFSEAMAPPPLMCMHREPDEGGAPSIVLGAIPLESIMCPKDKEAQADWPTVVATKELWKREPPPPIDPSEPERLPPLEETLELQRRFLEAAKGLDLSDAATPEERERRYGEFKAAFFFGEEVRP